MAIIDHKTTEAFLDIGGLRLWTVAQGSGVSSGSVQWRPWLLRLSQSARRNA